MRYRHSFMLLVLLPLMICRICADCVKADDTFTPVYNPTLHIRRIAGEIRIDGDLHDNGWNGAAVADNFVENSPGDQIKPPVNTKSLMAYDDARLYVAIVCYDNPEDIRASFCERDRIYGDDNVGFFFDTYGDAAWAYTMNINPHGIQADALWTNGFGEDSKYDLIWESAGQITDSGYQVELAIPFSSLRFPNKEKQTWKVEFWRHHSRDSHHNISWAAYDRNESCWPCQWGTVTGIENVHPGRGIEIIPSVVGFQSGQLLFADTVMSGDTVQTVDFSNEDADGELSISAKYSITSNITAEATINPDFSQVEADADQIDVNSTIALSFPEKRPFFQEGSDLFRTLFSTVYTRSINNPDFATKFTARIGRTSLSYLGAHDEESPVILPFEEGSSPAINAGKSISNILRARQTFGDNSQVGILVTDRHFEAGGSGSLYSLDGFFRLSQNFLFKWQAAASYTDEPDDTVLTADLTGPGDAPYADFYFDGKHSAALDGESYWGHGYIGLMDYDGRDVYISGRISETSRTFRADNGYEPQNNRRQASLIINYVFRFDEGLIEWIQPETFAAKIWNMDGKPKDRWLVTAVSARLRKSQIYLRGEYLVSAENYHGIQFDDIRSVGFNFNATPGYAVAFGGGVNYGNRISRGDEVMGKETTISGWLDLRPIDRLYVESWINYLQSRHTDTEEMLFKGYIARSRLSLQFSRELSLRFVAQYNDFGETWDFDPLITYQISPFSLFYAGTTYDYEKIYGLTVDNKMTVPDGQNGHNRTRMSSRQFFMKLQYMFQL